MPAHNIMENLAEALKGRELVTTAAKTVTVKELLLNSVISLGNWALTLPTAAVTPLKGRVWFIYATAAATIVGVAASKAQTVTLAEGDFCILYHNGTYFYSLGPDTAA
jgi:hypothetical protein